VLASASNNHPNQLIVRNGTTSSENVKVRIKATPREDELDGVRLDSMTPGTVREVSPSIGAWLIAERYAVPEMRHEDENDEERLFGGKATRASATDGQRRRSSDR
jgi:nicotinic acid phosphoribosyltransferase